MSDAGWNVTMHMLALKMNLATNWLTKHNAYLHKRVVKTSVIGKPMCYWDSSTKHDRGIEHDPTNIPVV